jgi:hypothetical protein
MILLLWLLLGGVEPPHSKVVVDNERVVIRDVGAPTPLAIPVGAAHDAVVVFLDNERVGDVAFAKRGSSLSSRRAIVVELKDGRAARYPNTSGFPNAFPRSGSKKILENDRVVVWDYTWNPGVATPVHFHDKDVVVVYLADGALTSTTPDGASTVNEHSFGFAKFNPGNRVHSERLSRGSARAIIIELKQD